jgi:hypothetical protein
LSNLSHERHKILRDILSLTPQGIKLNDLSLNKNNISINANVQAISSLTLFVDLLKNYPSIDTLSLDNIENKPSANLIIVSITAILKQSKYDKIK